MRFSKVKVYHFRNLVDAEIEVKAKTIILIGENGQGKTNFLEALYMLCFGSSFRTKRDREIINMQQEEMSLYAELTGEDEEQATVLFKNLKEKKEILLNGKRIADRKELLENVPCVLFSHEDMTFLLGGPEKRRLFLNQTMTLCRPESLETLRQYQKILRMRNICLKNGTKELTAVYNEQLARAGIALMEERTGIVREMDKVFSDMFNRITGFSSPVTLKYHPSWKAAGSPEDVLNILHKKSALDEEYGVTTTGPHRDSFFLIQDHRDFTKTASTGQLRLTILVLRIAQARLLSLAARRKPVLLFDDVLLELDVEKKKRILNFLPEYSQAFFTFLPDEYKSFMSLEDVLSYRVSGGKFEGAAS